MNRGARLTLAILVGIATHYFVHWMALALIVPLELFWLATLLALGCGIAAGRYVYRRTETANLGLLEWMLKGGLIVGGIGFVGGFFGPMIFAPEANQGPLLGLLITGPLGFLAGGIGGLVYGVVRRTR